MYHDVGDPQDPAGEDEHVPLSQQLIAKVPSARQWSCLLAKIRRLWFTRKIPGENMCNCRWTSI